MYSMRDILLLLSVPGIGPNRIFKLLNHFTSPDEIFNANIRHLMQVKSISEKLAYSILNKKDESLVDRHIEEFENGNIHILDFWDDRYPGLLKSIYDPPVILFVKGDVNSLNHSAIAIVGTRAATLYGKNIAEELAEALAGRNIAVVSGMARGIDTYAHRSALNNGGMTVAVLGSGLDVIYPPENQSLFYKMIEKGAVVTEFMLGTQPAAGNFPKRNRIISGLSLGTVVVEAGIRSGAMITAYSSLEQGREVFAVPGKINSGKSRGPHKLIKEGAKIVETVEDIVAEFPDFADYYENREVHQSELKLSDDENMIYNVLSDEPVHVDVLSENLNMTTSELLSGLLSLEIKQCVKQLSGMRFVRIKS